ncbi:hypothetical protein EYF80_039215 [Liparis tanakae]|uniref:Uncharacterized protein n=1 Tax=Liparis tanakae TaxID=230148 RepID=A0A4Z2GBV8_9TELE|nr:hypothetical protein EYF80_039215 [Liparis tanakae]
MTILVFMLSFWMEQLSQHVGVREVNPGREAVELGANALLIGHHICGYRTADGGHRPTSTPSHSITSE